MVISTFNYCVRHIRVVEPPLYCKNVIVYVIMCIMLGSCTAIERVVSFVLHEHLTAECLELPCGASIAIMTTVYVLV